MNKKPSKILVSILDVGLMLENSAVFQSQVVDQVISLRKMGYSLILLCSFKDRAQFNLLVGGQLENFGVQTYLVRHRSLISNIIFFALRIFHLKRVYNIQQVYVRSFWASIPIVLAAPFGGLSYLYDVRGDVVDESIASGSPAYRRFFIRLIESLALRLADHVTCVTSRLGYIVKERATLRSMPYTIPCCIDESNFSYNVQQRYDRRAQLGYDEGDIVLVYSGGLANYQMIPEMFALWRTLLPMDSQLKFLLLINSDPPSLERKVGNFDDFGSRLKFLNLSRPEVFPTLVAADIGFLLRENRPLNAAASPVKFAEYLAAGLAIISSPGIGDSSELIVERKLGVLVKPNLEIPETDKVFQFIRELRKDRESAQTRAFAAVREKYSWSAYQDTYRKIYGEPNIV